MKLNLFNTPVRCPACLNRRDKRETCATCEGASWLPFSEWLDALSDAGLQDVASEVQAILSEREKDISRTGGFLGLDEAAAAKGVHRLTLNAILNNEARRAAIFPGARRIGNGTRSRWQIPAAEVEAWQPRKDKRRAELE